MATKAELAAQLGDPSLADRHKRDELVKMVADLDGATGFEVGGHDFVTVYRVSDGVQFNPPKQSAIAAVASGDYSYTPVERKTRKKDG